MKGAYYNEIEPYAAQWLRNLIAAGHIPAGDVDTRSIVDVEPADLAGYAQCHFFAGIGGWAYAARLAGWPDDRQLWTGSAPCQPFSVAGQGKGQADDRHLWPHYFRLIRACRPDAVMGEQVAAAVGKDWLDGIAADLESIGYTCGATVVPACAVDAPHRRDRLWFVAHAACNGRHEGVQPDTSRAHEPAGRVRGCDMADASRDDVEGRERSLFDAQGREVAGERSAGLLRAGGDAGCMAHANGFAGGQGDPLAGRSTQGSGSREVAGLGRADDGVMADTNQFGSGEERQQRSGQFCGAGSDPRARSAWAGADWITGHDGKARRFEPGIPLLAHGVSARVGKLRAYGNAIVPQVAAEVIAAYADARGFSLAPSGAVA